MPKVEIASITVRYENTKKDITVALDAASTVFPSSYFNVVLGASGSGKSTLLKSIAGFLNYSGRILCDGVSLDHLSIQKRKMAYVSQEFVLYPTMTIFDIIAFPLKEMKLSREEIIEKVMNISKVFDLNSCLTRTPRYLSGGQQQRVAIARALVKDPDLALFDEPFSNIDPQSRIAFGRMIKEELGKRKATAIYVTHDINEAMALGDKVFWMEKGQIGAGLTPSAFFKKHQKDFGKIP